jgi:hypothetical protein
MNPAPATPTPPGKRGPKTPKGKARAAMNALKHGLRSRGFGLLPEEDPAEWAEHLADLRRDLRPVDPTEEKLVAALAVAMWKEIRADRAEAGVLTRMATDAARFRDLGERRNALSLGTAIRYATAAGMATQRAHRAFLAHRKAKQAGLILTAAPAAERAECTNDFAQNLAKPAPVAKKRTNEMPAAAPRPDLDPLRPLRARIERLLDDADPHDAVQRDLAAAMLAPKLSGDPPYRGPIELPLLDRALEPLHLDAAVLDRLAKSAVPTPPDRRAA